MATKTVKAVKKLVYIQNDKNKYLVEEWNKESKIAILRNSFGMLFETRLTEETISKGKYRVVVEHVPQ